MQIKIDGKSDPETLLSKVKIEIFVSVKSIYKSLWVTQMVVDKFSENTVKYMTSLEALYNSIERTVKTKMIL